MRVRKASALPKKEATKVNVNFISQSQSQITILLNHRRVIHWLESVIAR